MSLSYIRSLLITDPIIILATIVMGSISLLTSLFDSAGRIQHQISRIWSRMLLAVSGVKMRIEGLEKIDPGATYVFVANHRSFMDIPVLLAYLPLQFRFLAKKGLFLIPFLGTHLRRAGHLLNGGVTHQLMGALVVGEIVCLRRGEMASVAP